MYVHGSVGIVIFIDKSAIDMRSGRFYIRKRPTEEVSHIEGFVTSFEDIEMNVGLSHGRHMGVLYGKNPG
jgi:hypothetical protein